MQKSGHFYLGLTCDGDRWHYDKVEEDLARQALLERLGWRFVRIRGSVFYRDKSPNREDAMRPVFERLQQMGISPEKDIEPSNNVEGNDSHQQLECIKQRATELLYKWKNVSSTTPVERSFHAGLDSSTNTQLPLQMERPESRINSSDATLEVVTYPLNFSIDQIVLHPKFGKGRIAAFKLGGHDRQVQIDFDHLGTKWLALEYAKLTAL